MPSHDELELPLASWPSRSPEHSQNDGIKSLKIVTKISKKCHQYLRKRHLGVEEAGHPENGGPTGEAPSAELTVPLKKLREPGDDD